MWLTEHHAAVQDAVRAYVQDRIAPHAADWDREHHFPREELREAAAMGLFGVGVLALASWRAWHGQPPQALTMGVVSVLAFTVNLGVAWLLYRFRDGDANLRSVWLCSRNDALANLAVMAAAAGVFGTGRAWPDLVVAGIMAGLAVTASLAVLRHAREELAAARA